MYLYRKYIGGYKLQDWHLELRHHCSCYYGSADYQHVASGVHLQPGPNSLREDNHIRPRVVTTHGPKSYSCNPSYNIHGSPFRNEIRVCDLSPNFWHNLTAKVGTCAKLQLRPTRSEKLSKRTSPQSWAWRDPPARGSLVYSRSIVPRDGLLLCDSRQVLPSSLVITWITGPSGTLRSVA